jgi:hypothetical protein
MRRSQGSGLSQFKDGLEEFKKKWGDVVSAVVRACKHCERRCRVDGDDGDDYGEDDDGGGGGGGGGDESCMTEPSAPFASMHLRNHCANSVDIL